MGITSSLNGTKETELQIVNNEFERNRKQLLQYANELYQLRKNTICHLQKIEDSIRIINNMPPWIMDDINSSKEQLSDFHLAMKYESDPKEFAKQTDDIGRTSTYLSDKNTPNGSSADDLDPVSTMSLATLLGTYMTGSSISVSSGAAATNAALAWLGGGVVGSIGGMFGRRLALGLIGGAVGGAILATTIIASALPKIIRNKRNQSEEISKKTSEIRYANSLITQRMPRLTDIIRRSKKCDNELSDSIKWLSCVQPKDYIHWDENQKRQLEELMNSISNATLLINERI